MHCGVAFGGLDPELLHLSIVLNLAVVERDGVDPQYRQSLMTRLSEQARQRTIDAAASTLLMSTDQFELREQAKRDVASTANAKEQATPPVKKEPKQPPPVKKEPVRKAPYKRQDIPRRARSRRRTRSPRRTKRRQHQPNRRDTRR